MKKIFSTLLIMAVTMNAFALTYTAKAKVVLTSTSTTETCNLYLIQSEDLAEGVNNGYCSTIELDERQVALYAIYSSNNYQTFGTKTLGAMAFGIKTDAGTAYTMTVSAVEGAQTLTLVDEIAGTTFDLTEGAVYNFTTTANSTITDRFHLYVAPSVPGICHRYGKLQVSGSNGQSVAVKNMDDSATSIGTVAITSDYQEIDLAGLAAGQYKVEWNSKTLIIDVK